MKVNEIDIGNLIPYANNSRTHTDSQIEQIASSIKEFGFINPVIIDSNNGIIAGHCRVLAAQEIGLSKVPCIEVSHLTEDQKKAYIIADNKLALNAEWDDDLLKVELTDLLNNEFDITLTGFDESFLLETPDIEPPIIEDEKKFLLMLEFDNEHDLEMAFDEAQSRGIKCKIIE